MPIDGRAQVATLQPNITTAYKFHISRPSHFSHISKKIHISRPSQMLHPSPLFPVEPDI